jgi:ribosomal protein S24E
MEIVSRKDSKLLGRSEVQVLFGGKAGAINRKEAIHEVAQAMNSTEGRVTLVRLSPQAGSRNLVGWFHVYDSEEGRKEAAKAAKKKAEAAAAAAAAPAPKKKK